MDFITQNLLGAVASHAALGRGRGGTPGLGRLALPIGALGGAVPDFDFLLSRFADPALPWELHRHFTHALVFIPLGGLLAALPFLLFPRCRRHARLTLAAATIGCATHGLLDNLTSYGTHLLWPFIGDRTAWDSMSIIDPIFTGVLLLGVLAALLRGRARATRVALSLALMYVAFGFLQHERALQAQRTIAERRGHAIDQGRALPTLGNVLVFRSVYAAEGRLWADAVRVPALGATTWRAGTSIERFTPTHLPPDASQRAREVFDGIWSFADGYTARQNADDEAFPHAIPDMRLTLDPAGFDPMWGVAFDGDWSTARAWNSFAARDERAGEVLRQTWMELTGRDPRHVAVD
ncbi:MAG: metal-dependent hydrolase [Planctomycetota bacterium]